MPRAPYPLLGQAIKSPCRPYDWYHTQSYIKVINYCICAILLVTPSTTRLRVRVSIVLTHCTDTYARVWVKVGGGGWGGGGRKLAFYLLIPRPRYLCSCHSWPSLPSCSDSPLFWKALSLSPSLCCDLLSILLMVQQMSPSGSERNWRGTADHPVAASLRCTPWNIRWKRRQFAEAGSYCPQAGCKWLTLLSVSPYCCHPGRGNKTPPLWRYPLETSRVVNTGQQVARPWRFWSLGSMWPVVLTGRPHPGSRWATHRPE